MPAMWFAFNMRRDHRILQFHFIFTFELNIFVTKSTEFTAFAHSGKEELIKNNTEKLNQPHTNDTCD